MGAYQFLGISHKNIPTGRTSQADALICDGSGKTTTFNHRLFEDLPVGTFFVLDHTKSYPANPVTPITEDQIPGILKQDEENRQAAKAAYEKKKAENIATGRFKYWYTEFREGKAENILETLTDKQDEFWQRLTDIINDGSYVGGRPRETKLTVDEIQKDERYQKFMALVQPGDALGWYSWNGGFLAYSAGPCIVRNGEAVASMAWIVS